MPNVRAWHRTSTKPARRDRARERLPVGKLDDRGRQIGVGVPMLRHQPPDARQHVTEIPEVQRPRRPGMRGAPNSRIASRPPGRSTRWNSAQARVGIDHVADAERDHRRVERARRAAAPPSRRRAASCTRRVRPAGAIFCAAMRSISPEKSTPTTLAACPPVTSPLRSRDRRCPCTCRARARGPVSASSRTARRRQRRSSPALSRWLSVS